MIGWNSTEARDADEAIVNGLCDEDLDGLEAAIGRRRDALRYPACPECGEALKEPHYHGDVKVERTLRMYGPPERPASPDDRWTRALQTVLDAMAPPKRQDPPPETPQGPLP